MAKISDKFFIPHDREALLFSEDEDHGPLENFMSNLIKTIRRSLFEIATVVNENGPPFIFAYKFVDFTIVLTDHIFFVDASAAEVTAFLPTAKKAEGLVYEIKKIDVTDNFVVIAPDGSEKIDRNGDFNLMSTMETVTVFSTGTEWFVI